MATIILCMPVLFPLGATFFKNELLWAVYPPYTEKIHDALEVLDYGILFDDHDPDRFPSRVPMKRADVKQLQDAHDFGGGERPETRK